MDTAKLSEIIYPELLTTHKLSTDACLNNKYMLWKLKLTFLLKDFNVHHVVQTTNPNPADPAWEKAERTARNLILRRLDPLLFRDIDKHPNVKSFLDDLEATHNGTTMLKTFLCGEYSRFRMEPGSDINEHIFRMRAMAKFIGFAGVEMPEKVQGLALLSSLGDEWEDDVEKVMVELNASKESLSFDNVAKRLRVANQLRDWRKYRNFTMKGRAIKREKGKSSASNDDNETHMDFSNTLTEMIYSKLKSSGQLNYSGSDFRFWRFQICSVLVDNNVDYLLKSHDSPPEEDANSRSKRLSDDFIARHIMLGGMSDELFLTFHDYPTARALMDALESWFYSPSIAQQLVSYSKYTLCQMPENRDIDMHLMDMDRLVTDLEVAGVEIPDEMHAQRMIDSLPRSWGDIQTMFIVYMGSTNEDTDNKSKLVDRVRSKIRSAGSLKKVFKQN